MIYSTQTGQWALEQLRRQFRYELEARAHVEDKHRPPLSERQHNDIQFALNLFEGPFNCYELGKFLTFFRHLKTLIPVDFYRRTKVSCDFGPVLRNVAKDYFGQEYFRENCSRWHGFTDQELRILFTEIFYVLTVRHLVLFGGVADGEIVSTELLNAKLANVREFHEFQALHAHKHGEMTKLKNYLTPILILEECGTDVHELFSRRGKTYLSFLCARWENTPLDRNDGHSHKRPFKVYGSTGSPGGGMKCRKACREALISGRRLRGPLTVGCTLPQDPAQIAAFFATVAAEAVRTNKPGDALSEDAADLRTAEWISSCGFDITKDCTSQFSSLAPSHGKYPVDPAAFVEKVDTLVKVEEASVPVSCVEGATEEVAVPRKEDTGIPPASMITGMPISPVGMYQAFHSVGLLTDYMDPTTFQFAAGIP